MLTDVVSDEGLLPGLQTATFLVYPHMAESDHVFCVSSFFNFLFFGYTAQLMGFQFSDQRLNLGPCSESPES